MVLDRSPQALSLYDADYLQWLEATVTALKQSNLDVVDWENLIEEIEEVAKLTG
jgi:hypothetical protein